MRRLLALALLGLTAACSSTPSEPPLPDYWGDCDPGEESEDCVQSGKKPSTSEGFGGDQTPTPGASTSSTGTSEVWSHSADTLYRLDPVTKAVRVIGQFSGCVGDVIDIALDAQSNLFATTMSETSGALYRVSRENASCDKIADGIYPNSLSFVPRGTVDPNAEALVGYQQDSSYVRIDTKTGAITKIGGLGAVGLESSGDIVSVIGGPTYLTVVGDGCNDCLVEVNPKTGAITKNWGSLAHDAVYGIAFWAGSVYAFNAAGSLFELTFTGGKLATTEIPIPNKTAGLQFFGAGSTTSAPVTPTR